MISNDLISTFCCSAFFLSIELIDTLNQINNALDTCHNDTSDSENCHTSAWMTLIVTFFGNSNHWTACCKASRLDAHSALSISLSSETLLLVHHALSWARNSWTAHSFLWEASCCWIIQTLCWASFSLLTISTILQASGNSVNQRTWTGYHHVAFWIATHFQFCILLILPYVLYAIIIFQTCNVQVKTIILAITHCLASL